MEENEVRYFWALFDTTKPRDCTAFLKYQIWVTDGQMDGRKPPSHSKTHLVILSGNAETFRFDNLFPAVLFSTRVRIWGVDLQTKHESTANYRSTRKLRCFSLFRPRDRRENSITTWQILRWRFCCCCLPRSRASS